MCNFWGRGRFQMGFRAIRFFFVTVKNRENRNGMHFSNCSGYTGR